MSKLSSSRVVRALRDPWIASSVAGVCFAGVLIAVFGRDSGITWDEGFQRQYGDLILAWYRSGFRDHRALEYINLYLYGGLFDAPAQWIVELSPLDPFETRHMLSAVTALLGIVGAGALAAAVGGKRAGFFAGATLALTPTFIGHGLFNPKDIPFATAAVFVSLTAQRLALGPWPIRTRDALWAGFALGVALGVRPGGLFLVSYPFVAVLARGTAAYLAQRRATGRPPSIISFSARSLGVFACALPLAWLVMLSAWPWAQLDPFARPWEAINDASRFNWADEVLFDGESVLSSQLPARYLLVWFAITLPELYLVAVLAAATWFFLTRSAPAPDADRGSAGAPPRWFGAGMIAFSIVLPLAAAVITRPTLYDAHRHFLFVFPPLAALGGLGIATLIGESRVRRGVRATFTAAWVVTALMVVAEIVTLHPYEYVYFNHSVGGLRGAVGRFETDYWGASYREGFAWVVKHVRQMRQLRIAACDESAASRMHYYAESWPHTAGRFKFVQSPRGADLFLAVTRRGCNVAVNAEVLHVVKRQGAPLLYVLHPTQLDGAAQSAAR